MRRVFNSIQYRNWAIQGFVLALVLVGLGYFAQNAYLNLQRQNIASGFDFLFSESAFEIGESLLAFNSTDSFLKAFTVGLTNTLFVALIGNVLAVLLGIVVGMARVSSNFLVQTLSRFYIETLRNIPLLLQLFFWYVILTEFLPSVRQAKPLLGSLYLTQRGFFFPAPNDLLGPALGAILLIISVFWIYRIWHKSREWNLRPLLVPVIFFVGYLLLGSNITLTYPELKGFNFSGGSQITPELGALLLGLVLYTAAFIAEIVRSGIESIDRGQVEAGQALGMSPSRVFQSIVLPQAMRVIIPPLTSQLLNLTKNSSLAVAIGYPDLVSVSNTAINQTGQAIECILIIMLIYLTFSLLTSFIMNLYNSRIQLAGAKS